MKSLFVILLLIVPLASASMLPNETLSDYQKRTAAEIQPQNYTCGNGICEGLEQDTCPQDCALLNGTATTTTIAGVGSKSSQFVYILAGVIVFIVLVVYNFLKMNRNI